MNEFPIIFSIYTKRFCELDKYIIMAVYNVIIRNHGGKARVTRHVCYTRRKSMSSHAVLCTEGCS